MRYAGSWMWLAVLLLASPGQAAQKEEIRAAGTLSVEGRCRILTDDAGRQFALVGALGSFTTGDRIVVTGTVSEPSGCIEGTTLQVEKVRPDLPRRAARQTSLAGTQSDTPSGSQRGLPWFFRRLTGTG